VRLGHPTHYPNMAPKLFISHAPQQKVSFDPKARYGIRPTAGAPYRGELLTQGQMATTCDTVFAPDKNVTVKVSLPSFNGVSAIESP